MADRSPRARLWPSLALMEAGLTLVEIAAIGGPIFLARRAFGDGGLPTAAVAALAAALWLAGTLRALHRLRPVSVVVTARGRGESVSAAQAEAAQQAATRASGEAGVVRIISWALVTIAALGGITVAPSFLAGVAATSLVHALGLGALRVLALGGTLDRLRPLLFPTQEGIRVFAGRYRSGLMWLGLAVGSLAVAALALLAAPVRMGATARTQGALWLWPVLLVGGPLWFRSVRRRTRPIEGYFDLTLRSPGTRGPARDEPRAVAAFLAAQSLPYRAALYGGFVLLLAGLVAVAVLRRTGTVPVEAALRLLAALGLVSVAAVLFHALLARRLMRALMQHLGSRHHLPVPDIRSRVGLRPKLLAVFAAVALLAAGPSFLTVGAASPGSPWALPALGLALIAVVGLVFLVVSELVVPLQALELRSEEMARGELARPLPPSGEADEIGRLAVAFEEMRRALRDRLRSTESINVDLEREVRRRTEALEQKNAELRDALEKLRRAQDDLVRSEKLASMGRLVAGIAHEINNPVNAIINSLGPLDETLREMATARSGDEVKPLAAAAEEMLAVIQRGAGRTKAIVQALHNYSRGEETIQREVNLARSIDDTLDLLRHRLRDVKVVKEIEPGVRILGFAGQIDQVLMNLITNAAQALGERGGTIRISAHTRADAVEVAVADDGPGIPAEILPRIFDPFFTTKDVGEGSGLGLSIVHGLVDRHGGRIEVDSRPGAGTTFRMTFPTLAAVQRTAS